MKQWWRVLLLLLACLLGGSSPTWADVWHFNTSTEHVIRNHPALANPFMGFVVMYYDKTYGDNGFFTNQKPTSWASKIPSSAPDGPALFINGEYVCSPKQLRLNSEGINPDNQCSTDTWWMDYYTKTINGITYTVMFHNPYHSGSSKRDLCDVAIFADKLVAGTQYNVTIAGMWRSEKSFKTPAEEEYTWKFNAVPSLGVSNPTAEMVNYTKMKISGNLLSAYGPTKVGSYKGATSSGLAWTDNLLSPATYPKGNVSFTNQEVDFSERSNYFNNATKYIEYIVAINDFSPSIYSELGTGKASDYPKQNVGYYQWYSTSVPGFVRAKNLQATTNDLWKKEVKLTWDYEGTNSNGTWTIYRSDGTTLKDNLAFGTRNWVVTAPAYATKYTYKVVFIPTGGERRNELTDSINHTLTREWAFTKDAFKAVVGSDSASIDLSWAHTPIGDASGNKVYSLIIQRSTDGNNWTDLHTISISSSQTNDGTYTDRQGLVANRTYYYRLKINVLETDIYSSTVSTKLGGSKILTFNASRGSYSGMVKLQWTVKQVGTNITNFIIQRRPLNSVDERAWADIYTTSGTASGYSYDDTEAKPGSFYEYKVIIWSQDGETRTVDDARTIDGFSISTGILSGRISYGTGTAVEGAKVTLKRQSEDGSVSSSMHSVKLSGYGAGMRYVADNKELKSLLTGNFSIQMYLNPNSEVMNVEEDKTDYRVLDVEWALTISAHYEQAGDRYKLSGYFGGDGFNTNDLYIPAGEWSHLTVVHDTIAKTLTVYLIGPDGKLKSEIVAMGRVTDWSKSGNANCLAIGNVGQFVSPTWFEGYIDEFRFFTRPLSEADILKNYNHPLAGNEAGLAIYYPFDEGLTVQNLAYDFSKTNDVSNGRHAQTKVPAASSNYIPSEAQLSLMAYTDTVGNYVIRGVPFSGEGTNYSIIPTLGIHEFSPSVQSRFVSQSSLNHSGVDFEDISSFPVSGKVFYADTDYPVEGVSLLVDGVVCAKDGKPITTNADGEFEISVPIGDHFITVDKTKHVFTDAGRYPADPGNVGVRHTFNQPIKNLDFYDETLVNFAGRVVGGDTEGEKTIGFGLSQNNIGMAKLVLIPTNGARMNVERVRHETTYSYETRDSTLTVSSASAKVKSTSWRGAGNDNCRKIFILTDPATGEFSAMLPPVMYQMDSLYVPMNDDVRFENLPAVDLSNPAIAYSDTLYADDGKAQVFTYNTLLRQTFHSEPTFNVTQTGHTDGAFGLSSYKLLDEMGGIDIQDIYTIDASGKPIYKYGGAVFEQSEPYTFEIEAYEKYTNKDGTKDVVYTVPLKDLVVDIDNALSDEQPVYIEDGTVDGDEVTAGQVADLKPNQLQLDSLGQATYTWKAGLPNISDPYTRTISMSYAIGGRTQTWSGNGMKGIILGSMPTGSNFITSGPDMVDMILRDPPGTGSSAEWSSGTVVSHSTANMGTWSSENHLTTTSKLGVDATTITGVLPGVATVNGIESKSDVEVGVMVNIEGEAGNTWSRTVTATKTISTSDAMEYVGAQGDVFVGTATNIIFGKARNIGFQRIGTSDEVELKLTDIVTTGMDFGTEFVYTQNYIENVLIPNIEALRNTLLTTVDNVEGHTCDGDRPKYLTTRSPGDEGYGENNPPEVYECHTAWLDCRIETPSSDGPSYKMIVPNENENYQDSVMWCNNQIAAWKKYLYINEEQKVRAYELRTEKDSVDYKNYSFDSGASITNSVEIEETTGYKYDVQVAVGAHLSRTWGIEIKKTGVIFDVGTETTAGYHREDETGTTTKTSFAYTLKEEGDDDALTVDVYKYGAYGPIFRTRGGQTSGPYEGKVVTKYYKPGTIIQEATMQIEVPQIDVDVPVVSDIPTGGTANYTLRLSNASEIDEDVYYRLLVDDESNPDGAALSIDGKVVTDSRIIKIPAGQTVTKQLQLKQTNTSILDYDSIAVVLASQCQFDPTSTWDVIADTVLISAHFIPSSSPVELALSNTLMNTQTGTNLNLTFSNFDRNYRGLKAFRLQYKKQGSANWTQLHEYVTDSTAVTQNNELLPKTGAKVTYTMPMASFADGDYLFRIASVSTYGTGEVYRYSDELPLVKDMQRPTPLGLPEPTDGILSAGDEISVTFNDAILKGELTKEQNFRVTGVLNGAEIAHETALSMQDTETAAQTEANITLAGKDFSADMWVNIQGAGTILSHGSGASKMAVATDADGKLVVTLGGNTYTSDKKVPTGKWAFLTLSYLNTDTGGELSATVATDAETTSLFSGQVVAAYEGNGPLAVGKSLKGAIHELLLWDEAHDMTTALLNRSKTKNPSTRHLIGYWKMDEGEGKTIRDYARNRHMTMPQETWYLNNANKAVSLDGNHYMAINTSQLQTFEGDDYALEFWMRGDKQNAEAQLVQVGDVALWTNADGTLQLTGKEAYMPAEQTTALATTSGNILDNAWHHVALNILRQGSAAVYVDGKRVLTTSAAGVGSIASDKMLVGAKRTTFSAETAEYTFDRAFKGQVDELRVWSATMNADLLAKQRKVRLTGSEPGLAAYYPFETKTLDSGNQVVTVGTNDDLTGSGFSAELSTLNSGLSTLSYTDEAPALRTKPTETNVSFTYTASDTKVVISIDEDPAAIEGCTLSFTVRDVRDVNGNYSLPAVWSAFVNQKRLVWETDELTVDQPANSSTTVTATIQNNGGTMQSWTLNGIPAWMKASLTSGDTNPLAKTNVTFTITEATPVGKYEETIYLTGTDGIEVPLTIHVTVRGEEPLWAVDKSDYESSMNLIGSLDILGIPSEDCDDIVAAFIDGECRGVAHPIYDEDYDAYFVMMSIYGDDDDANDAGKEVTFKAYDASTGETYSVVQTSSTVAFQSYAITGDFDNPLMLSTVDVQEQMLALGKGWTWFSLFVEPDDMTIPVVFNTVKDAVSIVKSQQRYLSYSGGEWMGKTFELGNQSMYQVKMNEARTIALTGQKVNPQEKPITLSKGWNWVAYNASQTMSVTDALADMEPQEGDYVKSQSAFATYKNGKWKGLLTSLTPGQGYMIQVAAARTFRYPKATAASAGARMLQQYDEEQSGFFTPVDYHGFADNMTVIAQVISDGMPAAGVEVGVFAGEECRTTAICDDEGLLYLTIPGDGHTQLAFRMYDGYTLTDCDATLEYVSNATVGTIDAPFVLNAVTTGITDASAGRTDGRLYDLQGRRVYRQTEGVQRSTLKKGVYIENGQKRVKK